MSNWGPCAVASTGDVRRFAAPSNAVAQGNLASAIKINVPLTIAQTVKVEKIPAAEEARGVNKL